MFIFEGRVFKLGRNGGYIFEGRVFKLGRNMIYFATNMFKFEQDPLNKWLIAQKLLFSRIQ